MKYRINRRKVATAAAGTVAVLLASWAQAGSFTLTPSKDNTLFEDGTGSVSNGAGNAFFVGLTQQNSRRHGVLAFDFTAVTLPTNAQIGSASLALYTDKAGMGGPLPAVLHRVLKNWGEGTSNSGDFSGGGGAPSTAGDATWLHTFYSTSFWTTAGGDYSAVVSGSANMMVGETHVIGSTAQMASDVQGWLTNPATNFGWIVIGDEGTPGSALRIASREWADITERPLLTVNYNTSTWKTAGGAWSSSGNWNFGVPNAAGAEANFTFASGPAITVTVDGAKTVATMNFDSTSSYTLTGSAVTLDRAAAPLAINVNSGSHTIATDLNLNKNTDVTVAANSALTVTGTITPAGGVTLHKLGAGTLTVNNVRAAGLTIDGGLLAIAANSGAAGVSRVPSLAINSGRLNLSDNKLITANAAGSWNGTNYTGVTGLVASGKGSSNAWNGTTGIITTQSAAVGSNLTSIGVARAGDVRPATATATGTWAGQTITGTDTLVMYTYGGDANLDGKLNIDDYVRIDQGIGGGLTGWSNGDFNYDGKINIDDYTTVIDSNIGSQTGTFFSAGGSGNGVVAVPEPGFASVAVLSILGLAARRGRREGQASADAD